jgi:DNA-binding Lrp family transcriptional regulator
MRTAYLFINLESGAEQEVLKELKEIEGVQEAYFVYGVYDIIVKVQADSMGKLKDIVSFKIRRLDKVRSTLTLVAMGE